MIDGSFNTIDPEHKNYKAILDDLRNERYDDILGKIHVAAALHNYVSPSGKLKVEGNVVKYKGRVLDFSFVDRLLLMMAEDQPINMFVRFIERLMRNPSRTCIEELYTFMNSPDKRTPLPLLPDGRFLGYKRVRPTWYDWHSNRVEYVPLHIKYQDHPQVNDMHWLLQQQGHMIGQPRWEVDDTTIQECSTGFHVGTFEYIRKFHRDDEGHNLALAVDPAMVVAARGDSTQHKIRAHVVECRQELTDEFVAVCMGETPPTPKLPPNPYLQGHDVDEYASDDDDDDEDEDWSGN